jgi:tetratricopeptide (TPR) repeat protein|tara:strand:+ start:150 stop:614 length:465 start_codon:yes stop_codon:yes gene_type:complete
MKKILLIIIFSISIIGYSYGAASSSYSGSSNYDKGASLVKKAKKLEKKGKIEKANKRYEKAFEYLIKSNKETPNQPDTLNYLGYASRKLGNFEVAEKYYLEGLKIKPDHKGINEYLGELYIKTNRIDLAKQRLEVLKACNCEEYDELKELIDNN